MGAIRFSVGRGTTDAEIDDVLERLPNILRLTPGPTPVKELSDVSV